MWPLLDRFWTWLNRLPARQPLDQIHTLVAVADIRATGSQLEQTILADALREATSALNSTLELDKVLEQILTQVRRVVPEGAAARIVLTEGGGTRIIRYREDSPEPVKASAVEFKLSAEETIGTRRMQQTGQPVAIPDTRGDAEWADSTGRPDVGAPIRSYIGAPIQVDGELVGFLSVYSTRPRTFDPQYKQRLQAFADQAGIALRNARLYETVKRHSSELEQRVTERTIELQHERAQLIAILDGMSEGVIYHENHQALYVNHATSTLTGYRPTEWVGSLELVRSHSITEQEFIALYASIIECVQRKGIWEGEMRLRRKEGIEFDAHLTCTQVATFGKSTSGVVTVIRDISQEKALEAQKNRFVSNASHELRTPLTNLQTRLYLLRRQPEQAAAHFAALERTTERMKWLVEELLDISRFERGVITLNRREVTLQDLISDVLVLQQAEAERKQITLTCDLPLTPVEVVVDPERIVQVITNLVMNAIIYTPREGHVTLRLCAEPETVTGQAYAVLQVEDTGIGIAPEYLPRIFEPFFRVDGSIGGTGLGLTITKEIIDLHQGQILIESNLGSGTCFTLKLPISQTAASLQDIVPEREVTSTTYGSPGSSVLTTTGGSISRTNDSL